MPCVLDGLGDDFIDVGNDDMFPFSCAGLLATCV